MLGKVDEAFTDNLMYSVRYHYAKELRGYAFAFLAITAAAQHDEQLHSPDGTHQ